MVVCVTPALLLMFVCDSLGGILGTVGDAAVLYQLLFELVAATQD